MSKESKTIYTTWPWSVPEPYKSIYWSKAQPPKGVTVFYQETHGFLGLLFYGFFLAIALLVAYVFVPAPFQEYAKMSNETNDVSIVSLFFLSMLAIISTSAVVLLIAKFLMELVVVTAKNKIHYGIFDFDDCLVIRLSMWNAMVLPYDRITNVEVERVQTVEMKYPSYRLVISYKDYNDNYENKHYSLPQDYEVAVLINKRIKTGIAEAGTYLDKM